MGAPTALAAAPRPCPTTFGADFWYRHQEDTDETLRDCWQMSAPVNSAEDARAEWARLESQGYRVQRIDLRLHCQHCGGNGARTVQGRRRRPIVRPCKRCDARGYLSTETIAGPFYTFGGFRP